MSTVVKSEEYYKFRLGFFLGSALSIGIITLAKAIFVSSVSLAIAFPILLFPLFRFTCFESTCDIAIKSFWRGEGAVNDREPNDHGRFGLMLGVFDYLLVLFVLFILDIIENYFQWHYGLIDVLIIMLIATTLFPAIVMYFCLLWMLKHDYVAPEVVNIKNIFRKKRVK